jgi:hypothetical protein
MKKLDKDQIQKIGLSALMMIILVYCYFNFLLAPLNKQEINATNRITGLDAEIEKAKSLIKRGKAVQDQSASAAEMLAQINDRIPDGAPIAWFPPQMRAFFDRHNLKDTTTRGGAMETSADPNLAAFKNSSWTIDIPAAGADQLGIALAGLENENILLEITHLQINTQPDNLEKQRVSLNVITLLK